MYNEPGGKGVAEQNVNPSETSHSVCASGCRKPWIASPRGAKGYREASAEIEREIHRLWSWLRDLHAAGRPRPRHAVPPGVPAERRAPVTLP